MQHFMMHSVMNLPCLFRTPAKGKLGANVNVFLALIKVQIEKARYPGMEIFYQTEISFSNDPTRTINNHRLYVQMGEEGTDHLPLG